GYSSTLAWGYAPAPQDGPYKGRAGVSTPDLSETARAGLTLFVQQISSGGPTPQRGQRGGRPRRHGGQQHEGHGHRRRGRGIGYGCVGKVLPPQDTLNHANAIPGGANIPSDQPGWTVCWGRSFGQLWRGGGHGAAAAGLHARKWGNRRARGGGFL
ncbi:unnamed protein product, partial [Discosporangium mesarthrocarpum]